ncbi:hypothetical protein ID866_8283 [Astraeus odoratus]|nr:hypothetical protein ID866_8283 [Astraeus odoratus]
MSTSRGHITSDTTSDGPRPSASLVLINQRNEILLVQRNNQSRSFAGTHVFPGGNYDADQDASLVVTAIRETFEETGFLLVSPTSPSTINSHDLVHARTAIHERKLDFQTSLRRHNCVLGLSSLYPFTAWVTPPITSRRFHTQFYISFLSNHLRPASSEQTTVAVPTPDGGKEVLSARFVHPDVAIAEFEIGRINFPPPQYYILQTLRQVLSGDINTPEQRNKVYILSQGPFGRMVIRPKLYRDPESDIETFLYEGDELRGGPPGRLHRAVVKRKGMVFSEIDLQRNFDIFKDDVAAFDSETAKL